MLPPDDPQKHGHYGDRDCELDDNGPAWPEGNHIRSECAGGQAVCDSSRSGGFMDELALAAAQRLSLPRLQDPGRHSLHRPARRICERGHVVSVLGLGWESLLTLFMKGCRVSRPSLRLFAVS